MVIMHTGKVFVSITKRLPTTGSGHVLHEAVTPEGVGATLRTFSITGLAHDGYGTHTLYGTAFKPLRLYACTSPPTHGSEWTE
jgi:hypothetical protein